mgnify:CR=1
MANLTKDQCEALRRLKSNVVTILGDEATDADGNVISYDLDAVNAEVAAKAYQGQREKEYPSIADQLDDIYHNGIDGWKATIKAIKDKYPKE